MQNQREIKVEVDGFTIIIDKSTYKIEKEGVRIEGDVNELSTPQTTWITNTHACILSFVNSLNFDGSRGI